ncbi:hypothetical protein N8737_01000 [Verrucomicrobia bacterium]|nr:hypothetical protein [Verrucomicrobiota bacterium]
MPIHRQLLLRKVGLWMRTKPVATPQFLEVACDGLENRFDVPIEMKDSIDRKTANCRD